MRLYVLTTKEGKLVEPLPKSIVANVHVCYVKGNDWYDARARALQHAQASHDTDTIGILVGSCELYFRPHWNGAGPQHEAARMTPFQANGMWVYMERLSRRFAHVYVPPLRAMRDWDSLRKYPWTYQCNPVPACCAVYRVKALEASVGTKGGPWGQALCSAGYDSLTVSDYFHHNLGGNVLDESGSLHTWERAYERAIRSHL